MLGFQFVAIGKSLFSFDVKGWNSPVSIDWSDAPCKKQAQERPPSGIQDYSLLPQQNSKSPCRTQYGYQSSYSTSLIGNSRSGQQPSHNRSISLCRTMPGVRPKYLVAPVPVSSSITAIPSPIWSPGQGFSEASSLEATIVYRGIVIS